MTATRGISIVVLVAVVGLTIAPLATAGFSAPLVESAGADISDQSGGSGGQPSANEADRTGAADNGTSPKTDLSTFIQSNAAETEAAVDIGLFNASYDSADTELRKSILSHRTDAIEDRTAELEAQKETLQANEGEMSEAAYDARMTRLTIQINALEKSIETVEQRAVDTGFNTTGLEELRSNAAALGGPNVSAVAQGLAGIDLSDTFSTGIQERVNESTPDMPEIDTGNGTDRPELSAGNLSNGTLNATDVTDEAINATNGSNLIEGATNGTSVLDPTVDENSAESDEGGTENENATEDAGDLDGIISDSIGDIGSDDSEVDGGEPSESNESDSDGSGSDEPASDDGGSDGNESDGSETDEDGLDGLISGDLETEPTPAR
ncbi:hypothetical protein HALLA_07000 [Halostagnicola larsenii XH-48]|uniref:Uncharacterized protein n=1 Tax=Halostagnicola larsenii XH-48 TaxID=797299 RepID=W0JQA4_9EURY|nr:ABC transporter C-terminal domain-containing protein [Halostagnicola larsenii]AHG00774.1 hypothetical protein HALLA_07000 [Halostagnicola larsenii XH-48]